ncbi:MAG: tetratricopeptide repeat protein, partial [Candidatus Promineifilaceae bacterium]|nr:tetratricopeptide repeat protein [Candidatus Promineifilaceae bacterium]
MSKPRQDNPDFDRLFREGTRLLHAGRAERARDLLDEAHALRPDHADAALNLSGALILTRKFRRAVRLLEDLVEVQPDNPMVWTNLGAAYLGNPVLADDRMQRRAIEAFKQALELNPAAPNVAYNIGLICRDRGDIERAL